MALGAILLGINGLSNLVNGAFQRDLQRELHAEDFAAAERRFKRAERSAESRFSRDFNLRSTQFEFTQLQARLEIEERRKQHLDRLLHEVNRDRQGRLFNGLSESFTITPDAWFDHDPLAAGTSSIPSLRVIIERPPYLNPEAHALFEHALTSGINEYQKAGTNHPVFFPSGIWRRNAQQAGGSALTAALHAWNPRIPTLSIRPKKVGDDIIIEGDIFGFAMGERTYVHGIEIAKIPASNMEDIASIISTVALGFADTYFLNQHGQGPLLPHVLAQAPALQANEGTKQVVGKLITSSCNTIKQLMDETPQAGLYVALQMSEDLSGLEDKSYALALLQHIEEAVAPILGILPADIGKKLYTLYEKIGAMDEASRMQAAITQHKSLASIKTYNLENHL